VIGEIGPRELAHLLKEATAPLLLDVRETWELDLASIPGALNIPMAQIPDRLDEMSRDREIVVICHHGARSLVPGGGPERAFILTCLRARRPGLA
jgi:rhodanese-related sulfurtransferase